MDMLKNLNAAVRYIDENLCEEIDIERAALTAGITADSFLRFFSYMTGMTLNEYIHRRRLTLAADDIRAGKDRVVDIAVKYGYNSADAFSRAFAKQHGITPSAYRKNGGELQIYPPASLHIIIIGAKKWLSKLSSFPKQSFSGYRSGLTERATITARSCATQCGRTAGTRCQTVSALRSGMKKAALGLTAYGTEYGRTVGI